jgi:hypothetical protein
MEKNFDYYSNLAQKALESGNKEHAKVFMDKARSLATAPVAAPQAEAVDSEVNQAAIDVPDYRTAYDVEEPVEAEGKGFWGAAAEVPTNISAGVGTMVREVGETVDWAADSLQNWLGEPMSLDMDNASPEALRIWEDSEGVKLFDAFGTEMKWLTGEDMQELKAANLYNMLDLGDVAEDVLYTDKDAQEAGMQETLAGGLTHGVTQFLSGFVVLGGVRVAQGASYATQAAVAAGKGAVVDFTAFDAHEARASDMMIELGMEAEWLRYLAADEDDTIFEGKMKNAIEGLGLGVAAEGAFLFAKATAKYTKSKFARDTEGNIAKAEELEKEAIALAEEAQAKTFKDPKEAELEDLDGTPIAKVDDEDAAIFKGEEVDTKQKVELDESQAPIGAKLPDPEDPLRGAADNQKLRNEEGDFRDLEGGHTKHISWKESNVKAQRLIAKLVKGNGEDGVGIIQLAKQFFDTKIDPKDADAFAAASIQLEMSIWKQFEVLSKTPAAKAAEPTTVRKLETLVEALRYAQASRRGGASSNARALALQKQAKEAIPDLDFDMTPEGMIKTLNKEANAGVIRKGTRNVNKVINAVNEYWLNSLLSGWTTHAINLSSNAFVSAVDIVEVAGGASLAALKNPKEGARQLRLAQRQAVGIIKYARISAKMAVETLKYGRNILDEESMINESVDNIVGEVAIGKGNVELSKIFSDPDLDMVDRLGNIIRLPSRGLMGGDELFKQLNFRAKAYAYAAEEMDKALANGKIKPEEFDAAVEVRLDEAYEAARSAKKGDIIADPVANKGLKAARVNTFTNDLGKQGKALQSFVGDVPLLRQIIPFIRTPINILKYPLKRSPLGLASKNMREAIGRGGEEASQAIFQMTMGTALWSYVYLKTVQDEVEIPAGKGDMIEVHKYQGSWSGYTYQQKQAMRASGASPNSFYDEDSGTWKSYSRLDPFAMFLGVSADVREVVASGAHDGAMEMSTAAIIAIANQFKDKTYTKGVADFVKAADDPERYWANYMYQKSGSFVPSAVSQFNTDQDIRIVRSTSDAVLKRLPGFSETLEPSFDILGQVNPRAEGYLLKRTTWQDDVVRSEMFRLAPSIGKPSERHASGVDLPDFVNEDGKSAYWRYNELIGESTYGNRTLQENLERKILSYPYQENLGEGSQTPEGKIGSAREKALKKIVNKHREKAMKQLRKEFPELDQAIIKREREIKNAAHQRTSGQDVFKRSAGVQKGDPVDTQDLLNNLFD